MLEDLPVSIMAHTLAKKIVFAKALIITTVTTRSPSAPVTVAQDGNDDEVLPGCAEISETNRGWISNTGNATWLGCSAMQPHSALVNCFSPHNPADAKQRKAEVKGDLGDPLLKRSGGFFPICWAESVRSIDLAGDPHGNPSMGLCILSLL